MIVTLTGPSCGGKSTLEARLKLAGFINVISTTTRLERAGEENGKSYYFVTREIFDLCDRAEAFVERVEFNGNLYAVSKHEMERVIATGRPVVIVVEPHGLAQIREYAKQREWDIHSIFVNNPPEVLFERFLSRFAADVVLPSKDELQRAIKTYSSRLQVMVTEERQWVADAVRDDMDLYESVICPNETNLNSYVEMIVGLANNLERKAA